MLLPLARRRIFGISGSGKPAVKMKFGFFKQAGYGPEQRLRFQCGVNRCCVVARNIARLQFPDPIPARRGCPGPVIQQMVFRASFTDLSAVKAAELWRQPAQHPNQRELRCDVMNDKAESRPFGEFEAAFRFYLHFRQRLAGKEKIRVQVIARVSCVHKVSVPDRRLESAAQQVTASPNVCHPRYDENGETMISARLETL